MRISAENFDAKVIAGLAKKAGMKYIVLQLAIMTAFPYMILGGSLIMMPLTVFAGRDLIAEFVDGMRRKELFRFSTIQQLTGIRKVTRKILRLWTI